MALGITEIVLLGVLIGISALVFLVVLPWLALQWGGYRGCLRCGSELTDGAGHCLFCGHTLKQQRSLFDELIQRLSRSEEPAVPETTTMLSSHLGDKHSTDS